MLSVSLHEAPGHTIVAVEGFADESLVRTLSDQLAKLLTAPAIILDLADAVVSRPLIVRDLIFRLAEGRPPWSVRVACPRLATRRVLREVLRDHPIVTVASVDEALSDLADVVDVTDRRLVAGTQPRTDATTGSAPSAGPSRGVA